MKKQLVVLAALIVLVAAFSPLLGKSTFNDKTVSKPVPTGGVYVVEEKFQNDVREKGEEYKQWKADAAKRLYKEFCEFYAKMDSDEDAGINMYNRVMAADRACGILSVYGGYLSETEYDYVYNKTSEINDNIPSPDDVMVYFGYTESGMHFTCISRQLSSGSSQKFSAEKIREKDDEYQFLSELTSTNGKIFLDVLSEDLSGLNRQLPVKPYLMLKTDRNQSYFYAKFSKYGSIRDVDDTNLKLIKEYDRNCITDRETPVSSGSWNIFPFDLSDRFDEIVIEYGDEEIVLNYFANYDSRSFVLE